MRISLGELSLTPENPHSKMLHLSEFSVSGYSNLSKREFPILDFDNALSFSVCLSFQHQHQLSRDTTNGLTGSFYTITAVTRTEDPLRLTLDLTHLLSLHSLLFSLLSSSTPDCEVSPVKICDPSHVRKTRPHSRVTQLWLDSFASVTFSFASAPIALDLLLQEQGVTQSLRLGARVNTATGSVSLNLLSLAVEHLKVALEGSLFCGEDSCSVSLAATLSKTLSLSVSPVCLHVTPATLNLLLHFTSFAQLLPSLHLSLLLPKVIFFSKGNKSNALLHEELKRVCIPSRFSFSFSSRLVPFASLSIDIEEISLHLLGEAKEPLISASVQHIHCIPKDSVHQVEIGPLSVKSATITSLSVDRIRAEMTLSSLEPPTIASFSILRESAYCVQSSYLPLLSHHNAYSDFFRHSLNTPLVSVKSKLPPISVTLSKELLSSLSSLLHPLTPFVSIPSFSFFTPMHYHPPFLSLQLSLPSLSLQLLRDSFTASHPDDPFTQLHILSPSLSCSVGSQHFDLTASFAAAHLSSSFCHLSPPLLLETLTGYKEGIETDSWQQAQERYHALPERMTEILTISTPSSIHFHSHPHMVPSLHHHSLLNGQSDRGVLCTEDCFVESETVMSCRLGEVDVFFDDVCISDLLWGVLLVIESLRVCDDVNEGDAVNKSDSVNEGDAVNESESEGMNENESVCESEAMNEGEKDDSQASLTPTWEDPLLTGQFRIELNSPLLSLTCVYNHTPFQEFLLPGVFFELGFLRTWEQNTLTPSLCYCGADCRGIYWTDLTNNHDTNQACFCHRL